MLGAGTISTFADLEARMYTERQTVPACVRLLRNDGVIGCAAPKTSAPLQLLNSPPEEMLTGAVNTTQVGASRPAGLSPQDLA